MSVSELQLSFVRCFPVALVAQCVTQAATTYQAQRDRYACETGTSEWETILDAHMCVDAAKATGHNDVADSNVNDVENSDGYGPAGCYIDTFDGLSTYGVPTDSPPLVEKPYLNTGLAQGGKLCNFKASYGQRYGKPMHYCLCAYTGAACPNTDGTVANTLYTYDDSGIGTQATCGCGNNAVCANGEYCTVTDSVGTCS